MKILFMGTPDFAKESLENLYDAGYEVCGVVTTPFVITLLCIFLLVFIRDIRIKCSFYVESLYGLGIRVIRVTVAS